MRHRGQKAKKRSRFSLKSARKNDSMYTTPSRRAARQALHKTLPLHCPLHLKSLSFFTAAAARRQLETEKRLAASRRSIKQAWWKTEYANNRRSTTYSDFDATRQYSAFHLASSCCDESRNPISLRAAQGGTPKWVPKWYQEKWPCDSGKHPLKHHPNIRRSSEMHLCMYLCIHRCMHGCMHEMNT